MDTLDQSAESGSAPLGSVSLSFSSSHSKTIAKIAFALSKAQGQMDAAIKGSDNPFFKTKYASLSEIWDACRKPLSDNELAIVQFPETKFLGEPEIYEWTAKSQEKRLGVKTITEVKVITLLIHSSGEWFKNELSTLLPGGDAQSVGGGVTYMRRYALAPLVGVAPEDDDAESGQEQSRQQQQSAAPTGPETIKNIRPARYVDQQQQPQTYWIVETSTPNRPYITRDPEVVKSLENVKARGLAIVVNASVVTGPGGRRLQIVDFVIHEKPTS